MNRPWTLRIALIAIACCMLSLITVPAEASQDEAVSKAALVFLTHLAPKGYTEIRNEDADVLSQGQRMTYTVTLYRNVTYALFAAGCSNIRDLDIFLYDENGNLVARDTLRDNYPIVTITPRWTGTFRLQIRNYRGGRGWFHVGIAY
ncbi:MAG: hypothetical protein SX243_06205 [Acidobacteriota bacterium]|nr:hypothetical protein [Acidobacteriota bacterium]